MGAGPLMNAVVGGPGVPVVMGEVMGDKLITRPGRLKISCTVILLLNREKALGDLFLF